ncbi:hypothetical protein ANAPC1_00563 [Anaplasma phagocytophilum]|uniref:Uncharacterized protein n=1 Tax=Anaplasma phagocytophilum TaxID=948 RepID=A0AA45ZHF3_ANAPH|nr:hypothetical protein ANAPC1_00563 [Anaplasma phagocytophilum]
MAVVRSVSLERKLLSPLRTIAQQLVVLHLVELYLEHFVSFMKDKGLARRVFSNTLVFALINSNTCSDNLN